jgi:hypothetical protein
MRHGLDQPAAGAVAEAVEQSARRPGSTETVDRAAVQQLGGYPPDEAEG